jgi:hypothetical protein
VNIAIAYEDTIQNMMSLGVRCAASADRAAQLYRMIRYRRINRRAAAREVRALERHLDELLRHIAEITNQFRNQPIDEKPTLELVRGGSHQQSHQD